MLDSAQKYMGKLGVWLFVITLFFSLLGFFVSPMELAVINLFFNFLAVFPVLFRPMEKDLDYITPYSCLVLISFVGCFIVRYWTNDALGRYFDLSEEILDGAILVNNYLFVNILYFYVLYYVNAYLKMFEVVGQKRALVVGILFFVVGYFVVDYSSALLDNFLQMHPNFLEQTPNYSL